MFKLSTTVYSEAYTYTNDTTMVDNGNTNGAYDLHRLVNNVYNLA